MQAFSICWIILSIVIHVDLEVVADRCRFKKIDGVSMRITGDGGDVIYDNIHENHPVGRWKTITVCIALP